jgi:hypothetical protein
MMWGDAGKCRDFILPKYFSVPIGLKVPRN